MAGKRVATGRDEHEFASPAAHARLGIFRVVIRHDIFDFGFSRQTFLGLLQKVDGVHELAASWEKRIAIREGPSVVLNVRKFDAANARGFREREHFLELIEIAAMNHEIQCDANAMTLEPFENAELLRMRFCAGNFARNFFARALKAELKMVEASLDERFEAGFIERHAGGDEIDVETGAASGFDEIEQVGTSERLAAGEIGLEDAERSGFAKDARPVGGRKLGGTRLELERIGTINTVKRAAVR